MTHAPHAQPAKSRWSARHVWLLVLGVTLVRVIYLIWLCPIELAGDEAQYWDWSRRLDWSYYSKGPGIAWTIGASTALFGPAEWAIRLPAVLAGACGALALAALTRRASGGDHRAALVAAGAFLLVPVYQATGLLMTIDGPYVACWIGACVAAWGAMVERRNLSWWAMLGALLGIGFLYKYTILLLIPGLIVFAWLHARARESKPETRNPKPDGRAKPISPAAGALLALIVFAFCASPVFIWNAQQGWPTVAHLLGHAGAAGGDRPDLAAKPWVYEPKWTLEMIGAQIGIVGPLIGLMALALWRGVRRGAEPMLRRAALFALAAGGPVLAFYFVLTFAFEGEANWPIAGYAPLLVPTAMLVARELDRYRAMVREWLDDPARPKRGFLRRKPETLVQVLWHWSIVYGVVAGVGMMLIVHAARLPIVGVLVPVHRFSGWRATGELIGAELERLRRESPGSEPIVIARRYDGASRAAYYTPGQPAVFSAASFMGDRKSSYDYFPDTNLRDPALLGRRAVLVGAEPGAWRDAFNFRSTIPIDPPTSGPGAGARAGALFLGVEYGGPVQPTPGAERPR